MPLVVARRSSRSCSAERIGREPVGLELGYRSVRSSVVCRRFHHAAIVELLVDGQLDVACSASCRFDCATASGPVNCSKRSDYHLAARRSINGYLILYQGKLPSIETCHSFSLSFSSTFWPIVFNESFTIKLRFFSVESKEISSCKCYFLNNDRNTYCFCA